MIDDRKSAFRPPASAFRTKAQRLAEFESAPRTPKETRDFEANEARMDAKAQKHFERQVYLASERYRDALERLNDVTHAMAVGGAKTVPGHRSVEEHMRHAARFRAEIDDAELTAVQAAEAVAALQGKDPTEVFEAWVRSNPYLADRVS